VCVVCICACLGPVLQSRAEIFSTNMSVFMYTVLIDRPETVVGLKSSIRKELKYWTNWNTNSSSFSRAISYAKLYTILSSNQNKSCCVMLNSFCLRAFLLAELRCIKWSRYRPGVAQRVGRGIALLFHDRGTRRGWVVSSTPWPHFTPRKDPVPILQEAGQAPGPVWTSRKTRLHRDSMLDRPAHSQSLYRLSYPVQALRCIPDNIHTSPISPTNSCEVAVIFTHIEEYCLLGHDAKVSDKHVSEGIISMTSLCSPVFQGSKYIMQQLWSLVATGESTSDRYWLDHRWYCVAHRPRLVKLQTGAAKRCFTMSCFP